MCNKVFTTKLYLLQLLKYDDVKLFCVSYMIVNIFGFRQNVTFEDITFIIPNSNYFLHPLHVSACFTGGQNIS